MAATLGLGLAVACGSEDGQRVNPRDGQTPGGAGAGEAGAGAGAGGSANVSGSSATGGAAGESPASAGGAGAGGEQPVSGGAGGAEPGSEAGAGGAGGSGEPTVDLGLLGCQQVAGERPPSSNVVSAPLVADLQLDPSEPGEELSGSLAFQDTDPKELIVQVGGSAVHYVCPLGESDLAEKVAALGPLRLNPAFPEGSRLLYFGVRDDAGNVSAYLVGNLAVGQGSGGGIDVCESQPSVLLMGAVPSTSTTFYQQTNGVSSGYRLGSGTGSPLIVVASTTLPIDLGTCNTLRLAGDAAGTKPLGWDNCLVIEYRATVGGEVTSAWSFCGDYGSVYSVAGQALPVPLRPSLPGNALTPPVPSQLSFGYPALSIDLTSLIPAEDKEFELSLHVLDFGDVGSTTEVWALSASSDQ